MSTSVTFLVKQLHPVRVILHDADKTICFDRGGQFIGEVIVGPHKGEFGPNGPFLCQHGKKASVMSVDIVVPEVIR